MPPPDRRRFRALCGSHEFHPAGLVAGVADDGAPSIVFLDCLYAAHLGLSLSTAGAEDHPRASPLTGRREGAHLAQHGGAQAETGQPPASDAGRMRSTSVGPCHHPDPRDTAIGYFPRTPGRATFSTSSIVAA